MPRIGFRLAAVALVAVLAAGDFAFAKGGGGGGGGGGGRGGGGGHGGGHGAHRGGGHGGGHGLHRGGGHGRHFGRAHVRGPRHVGPPAHARGRAHAVHNMNMRAMRAVGPRNALNARALGPGWRNAAALRGPTARAQLVAGAAMAGWAHGRNGSGWWQHGNGGYGWVGPLFWPFAYYDIYDYALWGNSVGAPFWGYGYDDIYAGVFAPYGRDDQLRYLPPRSASSARNEAPGMLAQMCGDDSRDVSGLPIALIEQTIAPTEPQRALLAELDAASTRAAQMIKEACPAQVSLTAPGRLASMQQRLEAMRAAVATVQPALEKFYAALDEEQKARLNAFGEEQRSRVATRGRSRNAALDQSCDIAQPAGSRWPAEEIEARLHPTDAQRASFAALQGASAKAADTLAATCRSEQALTPPARLVAVAKRLDAMLQAVTSVRTALDGVYTALSDEQKAQFETIGPLRTAASDRALPGLNRKQRW